MPEGKQGLRPETSLADRLCSRSYRSTADHLPVEEEVGVRLPVGSRTSNAQLAELRGLKHAVTRVNLGDGGSSPPSCTGRYISG